MDFKPTKKPSFYFLKNSNGEYDGLWSLAIYSFLFIMLVTLFQLVISTVNWYYYVSIVGELDKDIAKNLKQPELSLRDVASWVSAFGGLCLAPIIAGYVARRNDVGRPQESIRIENEVKTRIDIERLDKVPVKMDDGH